jgi:hypothetical protein
MVTGCIVLAGGPASSEKKDHTFFDKDDLRQAREISKRRSGDVKIIAQPAIPGSG